jgi:C4-dicarboxylate transporter DctM subunit
MDLLPMHIYAGISKFLLLAVPFFIFAGNIMERSGISEKLIRFFKTLVGHKKGGLILVTVISSCFFAAISGSGPATVAALGSFLIPAMKKDGYDSAMSAALLASSGSVGTIIPPSIPFVIYGLVTGASISRLFMAGFIPGVLYATALAVTGLWMTKGEAILTTEKASKAEIWTAFKDSLWGIMMPVIILGGIYGGIFSPTEAAAVSCVYGLFVGVFIYKKLGLRDIYELMRDSISSIGDIMLIIACASLFAWFCSTSGITRYAIKAIQAFATNKYVFLALVNVILLIAGCFMDSSSAIYIFCPIIMPVARALKYDPVAMGVVFIVNLAIGNVTPPVGVNLFVACAVARITIKDVCKKIWPLLIASVVILLLLTYLPEISLFLPKLLLR